MSEYKPVRLRAGKLIHATDVESYRVTMCGYKLTGATLIADAVPDCSRCLRAIVDRIK